MHRERERRGEPGGKQVRSDLSVSWLSGGLFQRQIVLRAAPSFGQPRPIIPWAALAGHIGLVFRIGASEGALTVCRATRQRRRSKCSSSVYSASAPGCAGQGCGALRRSDAALGCGSDAAARQRGLADDTQARLRRRGRSSRRCDSGYTRACTVRARRPHRSRRVPPSPSPPCAPSTPRALWWRLCLLCFNRGGQHNPATQEQYSYRI